MSMRTDVVILAAGQGSRMKSSQAKVLHCIAGKPMLEHVIETVLDMQGGQSAGLIHVVVGHGAEQVRDKLSHFKVNWVHQNEQLGTGHAVKQTLPSIKGANTVLVVYGDVPLITSETLTLLVKSCQGEHLSLLTANLEDPSGYGRIVRDSQGHIQEIVEHKDANSKQLAIKEVNTGIMAIPGHSVEGWLNKLTKDNAQQEYYLTDVVAIAVAEGATVLHAQPAQLTEIQGVNSRSQLSYLERQYQQQQAEAMMASGVTILDPQRVDVRGEVNAGSDVILDVNIVFEGQVVLGNNVIVEPGCIIRNSKIGNDTRIKANSILEDAIVAENCVIGPFARLRPGTKLANGSVVGNFVEIKNSQIGCDSKINHLSYVGDAEVGAKVNVGAGTITCNYDGANKHKTVIGDGAFIGTNSSLVAPVTIGKGATTAAGSTITHEVPDNELGVARGRQRNINNWRRPSKLA